MATKEEVLETLRLQRQKFFHEKIATAFRGWTRVMQYHFSDIGLSMALPIKDGTPEEIVEGKVEGAQVVYEMSSDTFLAIARREITGMKAFTQKLVKVKASMPDLLKLQKLDAV